MEETGAGRTKWQRGLAVLVIVLLGAAVASPALSAKRLTKKKVRKIATKVLNQQLPVKGAPLFIGEEELARYGPITLQAGAADQTIGTFGPLSLAAHCEDDGGNALAQVLFDTGENDSAYYAAAFDTTSLAVANFDAAAPPAVIHEEPGGPLGGAATISPPGITSAMTPSGTTILLTSQIATNFGGSHCVFSGQVLRVSPKA